jgi:ribosome-binding protein aMBF1 (putative translation factor)
VAAVIKNDRQYRITKAQAEKFAQTLSELAQEEAAAKKARKKAHPLHYRIQRDALASQLETLREELAEYEALRGENRRMLDLRVVEEIPRRLIEARIAAGLSQRELAERLGLKEQQVQRYEATEYASASLARLIAIARALEASAQGERARRSRL